MAQSYQKSIKIEKYKNLVDHFLELIVLPVSAMGCEDFECKNSEHRQGIDSLYESFMYACVKATQLSIPSSSNHACDSHKSSSRLES